MKFQATVIPSGNATAVEIPADILSALGPGHRPLIVISINGHHWRSRVAAMRGQKLIGIGAAQRAAAGIAEGDLVEVDVSLDEAPREVVEPADLAAALNASPSARASFMNLAFGLRQKHVRSVEEAKSAKVRGRRIEKLVATLIAANS